ncbi:MAG TPA: hypothetical protein DCZ95_02890 [Verrucomicrobia bacterium]|nr:MAG: hypothetical protein A2X46_13195 [Lentisphaerae bacterium GWF2_57_35]HBA83019.1 hypothetical protein [Verrucomicrobiota bacterium]
MELDQELIRRIVKPPSERGVDYASLRDFLAEGKWQEADQETSRLMRVLGRKEDDQVLWPADIAQLPGKDLCTIDWLWEICSNARFGFCVQKRIWESLVDASRGYPVNYDDLCRFGDRVGWRQQGKWLNYGELIFNPSAPEGHLPATVFWAPRKLWMFEGGLNDFFERALSSQGSATSGYSREIFDAYVHRIDSMARRYEIIRKDN